MQENTLWRDKANIRSRFRYDTDIERTVMQGEMGNVSGECKLSKKG